MLATRGWGLSKASQQRLRAHQVGYVCFLAHVIALGSPFFISDAASVPQATSDVCSTNLASQRPCEPAPACKALFDDDNRTTLPEAFIIDAAWHHALSDEESTAPGDAVKVTAAKFASSRKMFSVFLKQTYNLTRIVVFCFQAHNHNNSSVRQLESDLAANAKHQHTLEVATWEVAENESAVNGRRNASSHQLLLVNASGNIDDGVFRIEFAIDEIAAIVAVQPRSVCGGNFEVAEVAIMGRDMVSSLDDDKSAKSMRFAMSDAMTESLRQPGNSEAETSGEDAAIERRMPSVSSAGAAAHATAAAATVASGRAAIMPSEYEVPATFGAQGELVITKPSQGLPSSSNSGFLAPTAAMAAGSQAAVIWFAIMGVSTLALSFLCFTSKLIKAPDQPGGTGNLGPDTPYRAISSVEDQETGAAGTVFHWIGDSDESQPASPRPFHSPLISSESEPECEMDPSGSEQPACEPAVLGRPVEKLASIPPTLSIDSQQHTLSASPCSSLSTHNSDAGSAGGRVTMLYASPLCHEHQERGAIPMPQLFFEREWEMLLEAGREAACDLCPLRSSRSGTRRCQMSVELAAELLTAKSLQRCVAPSSASAAVKVLHMSAHSVGKNGLVLENGRGSAHIFSLESLRGMLNLRREIGMSSVLLGLRLAVLNACNSLPAGIQFVEGGVPHVICTAAEIRDTASGLFTRALYSSLFQGSTVAGAFESARVALRSDPDIPYVDAFRLLPEGASHEEILFPPEKSEKSVEPPSLRRETSTSSGGSHEGPTSDSECGGGSSSNENGSADEHVQLLRPRHEQKFTSRPPPQPPPGRVTIPRVALGPTVVHSPFGRIVPPLPEDFNGRWLDVWQILQAFQKHNRRVVVVCGSTTSDHGIGKSAVMDATHRAFSLQVGGACIAVHLRTLSDPNAATAACEGGWIEKVMEQVHKSIQERQRERRRLPPLPRSASSGNSACGSGSSKDDTSPNGNMLRRRLIRSRGSGMVNRAVRHGFHPLSDPIAAAPALEALVSDMLLLSELCEARCGRDWPAGSAANSRILLILDECDHLIQQGHFQEAIADLLRRCPSYRMLISTQQPMHLVSSSLGQFKVVHHALEKLNDQAAALLFLRRAGRAIRWEELPRCVAEGTAVPPPEQSAAASSGGASSSSPGLSNPGTPIVVTRENEAEVLRRLSMHPCVKAQAGNPRRLIELASLVTPSLQHLSDLAPPQAAATSNLGLAERAASKELPLRQEEEVVESSETAPLLGA